MYPQTESPTPREGRTPHPAQHGNWTGSAAQANRSGHVDRKPTPPMVGGRTSQPHPDAPEPTRTTAMHPKTVTRIAEAASGLYHTGVTLLLNVTALLCVTPADAPQTASGARTDEHTPRATAQLAPRTTRARRTAGALAAALVASALSVAPAPANAQSTRVLVSNIDQGNDRDYNRHQCAWPGFRTACDPGLPGETASKSRRHLGRRVRRRSVRRRRRGNQSAAGPVHHLHPPGDLHRDDVDIHTPRTAPVEADRLHRGRSAHRKHQPRRDPQYGQRQRGTRRLDHQGQGRVEQRRHLAGSIDRRRLHPDQGLRLHSPHGEQHQHQLTSTGEPRVRDRRRDRLHDHLQPER